MAFWLESPFLAPCCAAFDAKLVCKIHGWDTLGDALCALHSLHLSPAQILLRDVELHPWGADLSISWDWLPAWQHRGWRVKSVLRIVLLERCAEVM